MRQELETAGHKIHVTSINLIGAEATIGALVSRCSFDCLQDVASVNAWNLMGGGKDDIYVYREGGRLAPGGYFSASGPRNSNLSTPEGYGNIRDAVLAASALGPGESCPPPGGAQLAGDFNQDGSRDISDPISIIVYLFAGGEETLPCEPAGLGEPGNLALLDVNDDHAVDLSDAVHLLGYLFLGGPPPAAGTSCTPIAGCPDACSG